MTCTCNPATGAMCDYALSLSDYEARRESDYRTALRREREGGPPAWLERESWIRAKNNRIAHMHGAIPPEEQDRFCDCCGMRGVQHQPENANERYGT